MTDKYIITGLPRCRSAWTSVFLGCTAHPFNRIFPEEAMGINCFAEPGFLLMWEKLYDGRDIVVIKRDYEEALKSSIRVFGSVMERVMPKMQKAMEKLIDEVDCYVVDYAEYDGKALWKHLYKEEAFSEYRYERLSELDIQTRNDVYINQDAVDYLRGAM